MTIFAAAIAAATVATYWPSFNADFVLLDDAAYITHNDMVKKGLTAETFQWAWSANLAGNWQPLTLLSHMLDVSVFGLNARGHHAVNVALHVINALLVLILLQRLTASTWPSAIVALLFAVHPVRVESVAWVAERKDVLSTFFALLAMMAYSKYAQRPGHNWYLLATIALLLSLLCKAMFVTLPFLLLLLDVWPMRRWRTGWLGHWGAGQGDDDEGEPAFKPATPLQLIVEKIPLLAICIGLSVVAWIMQRRTGATQVLDLTFAERIGNAVVSYARYLGKTFWPVDLVYLYPHPRQWPLVTVLGSAALVVIISVGCAAAFRRRPYLLIGWLWFIGTLVPVIGVVQIGHQSIADRYLYFPQLGILIAIVWTVWTMARSIDQRTVSVVARAWGLALSGAIALTLAVVAHGQVRIWRNTETLYRHAVEVYPDHVLGLQLLAQYLADRGENAEAMRLWERAGKLAPDLADQQLAAFERELKLAPNKAENMNNVAWYLATHYDESKRDGRRALQLALRANELGGYREPLHLDTLAAAYAEVGNFNQAVQTAQQARDLAIAAGQPQLVPDLEGRMRYYQAQQPFRLRRFE